MPPTLANDKIKENTDDKFFYVNNCRCCGHNKLIPVLGLGNQPLANTYRNADGIQSSDRYGVCDKLDEFPLELNLCPKCFHSQLSAVVNPHLIFDDYLYVSGTTHSLRQYFKEFAASFGHPAIKSVLDIACNDGTQLEEFKKLGWDVFGVDPAKNLLPITKKKNINVSCDYWSVDTAKKLDRTFEVIVAQNVFAHVHDILDFLLACKEVMHDKTELHIQVSQRKMFENFEFDTIYHEHVSVFSTRSMQKICERAGLYLNGVYETPVQGSSYGFLIGRKPQYHSSVTNVIWNEVDKGRYTFDYYKEFGIRVRTIVRNLKQCLDELGSRHKIVGYGAAAKGNTLLNYAQIDLDYIVDDNELKWNLYTPGRNILITNPERLETEEKNPLVILPLAWNFFDEIYGKVKQLRSNSNDIFVKFFPDLKVTT